MVANIRCSEIMADQLDAFKHDAAWVRRGVLGANFDGLRSWQAGGSSDQCRYHWSSGKVGPRCSCCAAAIGPADGAG